MKILLLAFWYPPTTSANGIRAAKTAEHLRALGHEVKVLTVGSGAEPPLSDVIRTRWLRVNYPVDLLVGEARAQNSGYTEVGRRFPLLGWLGSAYRWCTNFPDGAVGWIPYLLPAARKIIREWAPNLVLATSKPDSTLVAAHLLSREHPGLPWVAEMCDLWTDNHWYRYGGLRKWLERRLERAVLRSARALCTISEPWAEVLRRRYPGKPVSVFHHAVDPEDFSQPGTTPGPLTVLYTGTAYEGYQDPSPLFEALLHLPEVRVHFYGRDLGWVRSVATRVGVQAPQVEFHTTIPHAECLARMQSSDVLLLLLWNDPKQTGVHTYKLYDYLGARRPILALGRSGNVASDVVLEQRAGVVLQHPQEVLEQLRAWIAEKREKGEVAGPGELSPSLTRGVQVERLSEFLKDLIREP